MAALRSPFLAGGRAALHRPVASASVPPFSTKIAGWIPRPMALKFRVRSLNQQSKVDTIFSSTNGERYPEGWKIKMLYDGDCPLCMREVNFLRKRNETYGAIKFVDIGSTDYSPDDNGGLDYKTVMGNIHAILSDGTVVKDVEAFRRLYEEVGLGWVYAVTKYEPVATIAGAVYGVWAKYRLQITGRPPINEILELRKKSGKFCGDKDKCSV